MPCGENYSAQNCNAEQFLPQRPTSRAFQQDVEAGIDVVMQRRDQPPTRARQSPPVIQTQLVFGALAGPDRLKRKHTEREQRRRHFYTYRLSESFQMSI
jgi:hypothetical protein